MNQDILNGLDPVFRRLLEIGIDINEVQGRPIRLTSGRRTPAEQDRLYAQGRTVPGVRVTNSRGTPMQSFHGFGCAVDFIPLVNGRAVENSVIRKQCIEVFKSIGIESGDDWITFRDPSHLQYTQGQPLSYFQKGGKLVQNEYEVQLSPAIRLQNLIKRLARTTNSAARSTLSAVIERLQKRIDR